LGNLIDNACKYGKGEVRLGVQVVGQQFELIVEDNGRGLESSQFEAIIQRGKRLDQSREGQGIGLAVVSEIVDAYELEMKMAKSVTLGGLSITVQFNLA
jgi:two-component system sensor histidine kinase PhoQ